MGLTVVGGIAFDTISVAGGKEHRELGGSGVYAALAAAPFGEVTLVGAIGDDCTDRDLRVLRRARDIDLRIQQHPGRTTRFVCSYDRRFVTRTTIDFEPGVQAALALGSRWEEPADVLFLASGPPDIQLAALDAANPRLSALDTIDGWIHGERPTLGRVISRVSAVLMTAEEILEYTGKNLVAEAAADILRCGPRLVCVKQGEFGAQLFANKFRLSLPAFEAHTRDPTGAGDAFAGAFLSYLATSRADVIDESVVGEALVLATAVSSVTIEQFGTRALASVDRAEVVRRCRELLSAVHLRMPRI